MALFGRKKKFDDEVAAPPTLGTPTARVMKMRQQGYTDNQIVQGLQKENYTSTQIFDALSQSDLQRVHPGQAPEPMPQEQMPGPQPMPPEQPMPRPQQMPMPQQQRPPRFPQQTMQSMPAGREQIEEVAEAIIDEKWEELMKGVNKIIVWKDSAEERLTKIQDDIDDLKHKFSELHTGVLGKISEYDKGIRNVGTDVKAMQEVFKKALPKFTENIAALERISKKKVK